MVVHGLRSRFPTGSTALDSVTGTISFTDVDLTDRPVASAVFASFTYTDALGHPLTLTALQQADVAAVAVPLSVTQAPGNTNPKNCNCDSVHDEFSDSKKRPPALNC